MKSISGNLLKLILIPIIFITFGCEGIVEDFSDMTKFRDSLQKVYPDEDIRVKVSNGTYLSVTFVNSDLKDLEKEKKESIAKNVGKISRHYFKNDRIIDGRLTFGIYKNYVVFKYSESIDTYNLFETDSIKH